MTDSGVIYCPPDGNRGILLKIDTNPDNVTELDRNLLPEQGDKDMWTSSCDPLSMDASTSCHQIMLIES